MGPLWPGGVRPAEAVGAGERRRTPKSRSVPVPDGPWVTRDVGASRPFLVAWGRRGHKPLWFSVRVVQGSQVQAGPRITAEKYFSDVA